MRTKGVFAAVVVAGWVAPAGAQTKQASQADGPPLRFTEQPGKYAVGLKVAEQYDFSRTHRTKVDAGGGRPTVGEQRQLSPIHCGFHTSSIDALIAK
jgi:hypothetical protein